MPDDPRTDGGPYVEITQVGRWTWSVVLCDGLMGYGASPIGWRVLGRARAERLGRRKLATYLSQQQREDRAVRIYRGDIW